MAGWRRAGACFALAVLAAVVLAPVGAAGPSPASARVLRNAGHLWWVESGPRESTLWVAQADGSGRRAVLKRPGEVFEPAVSRRGDRVAFTTIEENAGRALWIVSADGSRLRALTAAVEPGQPSFSGDGGRVVYVSSRAALRVININGTGDRLVVSAPGQLATPEWAPQGDDIVYARHVGAQGTTIEIVDADAPVAAPRLVASTEAQRTNHVRWSPDGRRLSYILPSGVFVVDVPGGTPKRVAPGGDATFAGGAPWSPDGASLLVCRLAPAGGMNSLRGEPLTRVDLRTGQSTRLGEHACLTPAWSRDGRFTAAVEVSQRTTRLLVRGADGRILNDMGPAWGVGTLWTA